MNFRTGFSYPTIQSVQILGESYGEKKDRVDPPLGFLASIYFGRSTDRGTKIIQNEDHRSYRIDVEELEGLQRPS